ncbi:phosphate ABC transporter permease PtsA [Ancylomarina euxinus]|uniref:Phosphate transport system permease protein PstA n=1 Tax=Ancylomarina euxinus TaxID=2283627 RepID=A0A425Y1C0_9BACT|nr:phosphate ABC transporter permease PstA [Ancylomarina euxinus]MCZ4693712.1 phosphate ABC transporter permease PstA [Ancylomarina euxinus]MUP15208.1 phosphate ABC transporter permease PstA [Ancylomarina euxinus]RRG21629.1 phosphate ABC transporter permease PtsA [Ancylomarina euxinus]
MNISNSISQQKLKWRIFNDRLFSIVMMSLAFISALPLLSILYQLIKKGYKQIRLNFFIEVAPDTMEAMMAKVNHEIIPGGIANGIVGTLIIVGMASLIAIPLGLICGIYLSETSKGKMAGLVRFVVDMLQGVPSIVLGVIAYIWIVKPVTSGFSALAGSVALSIMMLPSIIRSTEETLKMIPSTLKEAALSLGVPYHRTIFKVLLPTGMSGIATGIILGISRIAGETAPLMLTALGSSAINLDITQPSSAIPLLVWEFYNDPNLIDLIWGASLILLLIIFLLNLGAKAIAKKWKVQY